MDSKVPVLTLWGFVFLAGLFTQGCSNNSSDGAAGSSSSPKIYVTIYSHNEDSWGSVVNAPADYVSYRNNLLERLKLIASHGATLNWQSDLTVLEAMIKYEPDSPKTDTNAKNIVRYMVEDLGFSVDPHGHLVYANYADLAYLIRQLGVEPSGVIGGAGVFDCGSDYLGFLSILDWHPVIELSSDGVIRGERYPASEWRPTILSGPAMGGALVRRFLKRRMVSG